MKNAILIAMFGVVILIELLLFKISMQTQMYLDRKIDELDEAIFQHMKEEHNSKVSTDE